MKRLILVVAIPILITASNLFAQAGSAGFQILKLGYSSRDLSLANSADAVTGEPVAVFTNPAGIASPEEEGPLGWNTMLAHRNYIAGTTIDLFATRFQGAGFSFATGLLLSSVPDIEVRTVAGDAQGTFDARDFAFALGVARSVGDFDIGVSGTFLYEKIFVYESSGIALNGGIDFNPASNTKIGFAFGNIGSASEMIAQRVTLPHFVRLGGSYSTPVTDYLSAAGFVGVASFKSGGTVPSLGVEMTYDRLIVVRAGYASGDQISRSSLIGIPGFSAGAGIRYEFLRFDYSYIPLQQDFGSTQVFTLSFYL